MRRLVLATLILAILAVTASDADARRRHWRHYVRHAPVMLVMPDAAAAMRGEGPRGERGRGTQVSTQASMVPRDWQLQPPDPNWNGRRYVAPDGSAWIALYASNAGGDAAARLKAVAFVDGEEVTYLRGERDRLTVSGLKNDRIFYRKVMLACGGTSWRHVALEYPAEMKERFDRYVTNVSRMFDRIAEDSCGENLFTHDARAAPAADAKPADKPPEVKPAEPKPAN